MVRKIVLGGIFLFSILITLSLVSAYDTEITVITYAEREIEIGVFENPNTADGGNFIESFREDTGEDGKVTVTVSSPKSQIYVNLMLFKNGRSIKVDGKSSHRFPLDSEEFYIAGIPLSITFSSGETILPETTNETETNETEINETEEETVEQETGAGITGQVISEEETEEEITEEKFPIPKMIYIGIAVVVISSLIVFLVKIIGAKRTPEKIKLRKYSDMVGGKEDKKDKEDEDEEDGDDKDDELSKAEKKLKEVQEEIERIKNRKSKLTEAEEKFEEAKKELEKARKEESD